MAKTEISPAGSLKGYSIKTWFLRTKNSFKALAMAVVALVLFFMPQLTTPEASVLAAAVGAAFTKWLADSIDFWLTDVELEE